ncbi:MAG: NAD(P)-dependent oxidoreductase [Caldilineaceae bacterium]
MRLSRNLAEPTRTDGSYSGAPLLALTSLLETAPPANRPRCVLITHVLDTTVPFIEAVHTVFPVVCVVAIPYSCSPSAVQMLQKKRFKVVIPTSICDTFLKAEKQVVEALKAESTPLLVQEVGGYLAKSTERLATFPHFLGIVEDTNNGHWRYERNSPHPIPVLSMAQSPLKAVEDSIIGDAVLFSVERILREEFKLICQGLRSAVIGFGKIGRSCAVALNGREAVVSVYDINPAKNISAEVEGFFPQPLHELLAESDLIVGCTGQTSIRRADMYCIKNGAILASASSKAVEFALADFEQECVVTNCHKDQGNGLKCEALKPDEEPALIQKYTKPDGTYFYVLKQGTPVNFRDHSILGNVLDLIFSELFLCMREVAAQCAPKGLSKSLPRLQDEAAKAWLKAHAEEFTRVADDKIWSYPESLKLGLPKW